MGQAHGFLGFFAKPSCGCRLVSALAPPGILLYAQRIVSSGRGLNGRCFYAQGGLEPPASGVSAFEYTSSGSSKGSKGSAPGRRNVKRKPYGIL